MRVATKKWFNRFDRYLIQTDKQTNSQAKYINTSNPTREYQLDNPLLEIPTGAGNAENALSQLKTKNNNFLRQYESLRIIFYAEVTNVPSDLSLNDQNIYV